LYMNQWYSDTNQRTLYNVFTVCNHRRSIVYCIPKEEETYYVCCYVYFKYCSLLFKYNYYNTS
jgi:hypothetical protein